MLCASSNIVSGAKLVSPRMQIGGKYRMSDNEGEPRSQALLDAAVAGESWAFTEIYRLYAQRVKAFAASRRVEDPDGLANDVMLKVFQNLAGFSGDEASFESWMFTIARNRIIDAHRASQRRPQSADRAWSDASDATEIEASAEEQALEIFGLDDTIARLNRLTEDQRDVVALRMIADLSLDQVAAIVDKPVTAVKALQRRGLARLQREILDEGVS